MRIAVLADIHGNSFALDAVLDDVSRQDVDLTINLGDALSGGVDPAGTMARLRDLALPTVRGNHERQLLTTPRPAMGLSDALAFDAMSPEDHAWLRSLPLSHEISPGVLAFHGTPSDDATYLLESVDPDGARAATHEEIGERLGDFAGGWPLLLCGHTHLQREVHLASGATVVNPGSVGWPAYDDDQPFPHVMEAGTPHARYAIVESNGETWSAALRAIDYDVEPAAELATANGRADVAHALRTGRAGP